MIGPVYDAYRALTRQVGADALPGLALVGIVPTSDQFAAASDSDRARMVSSVAALERQSDGWTRRQSWRCICPSAPAPDDAGLPIAGEWAPSAHESVQLSFTGNGWTLIHISEVKAEAPGSRTVLRQDVCLVAEDVPGTEGLRYAVYWDGTPDDPAGLQRVAARFVGFAKGTPK